MKNNENQTQNEYVDISAAVELTKRYAEESKANIEKNAKRQAPQIEDEEVSQR